MRPIDAERLDDKLHKNDWAGNYPSLDEISDIIANQPTIDLVKHGHWVQRFTGDENIVFCSNCSEEANEILGYKLLYEYDFCPYCGAKMDEV